jgi:hypothetical protein
MSNTMPNSFNYEDYNELVQKATDAVLCNSECQQQREAEKLKQTYLNAKTNVISSSGELQTAEKNYITFTKGTSAYNQLLEKQLGTSADTEINNFTNSLQADIKEIQTYIETYNGVFINFKNVLELLIKYTSENIYLFRKLKKDTNDVLTNERKTYYENENIERLKFYYYYFFATIYIIFLIRYIVFSFQKSSQFSWKIKLIIFLFLIILPFVSPQILSFFIFLLYKIYENFPKNVYLYQNPMQ